jgi:hypothetical protein
MNVPPSWRELGILHLIPDVPEVSCILLVLQAPFRVSGGKPLIALFYNFIQPYFILHDAKNGHTYMQLTTKNHISSNFSLDDLFNALINVSVVLSDS